LSPDKKEGRAESEWTGANNDLELAAENLQKGPSAFPRKQRGLFPIRLLFYSTDKTCELSHNP